MEFQNDILDKKTDVEDLKSTARMLRFSTEAKTDDEALLELQKWIENPRMTVFVVRADDKIVAAGRYAQNNKDLILQPFKVCSDFLNRGVEAYLLQNSLPFFQENSERVLFPYIKGSLEDGIAQQILKCKSPSEEKKLSSCVLYVGNIALSDAIQNVNQYIDKCSPKTQDMLNGRLVMLQRQKKCNQM